MEQEMCHKIMVQPMEQNEMLYLIMELYFTWDEDSVFESECYGRLFTLKIKDLTYTYHLN